MIPVIHISSFGTWQIHWDEITSMEVGEVEGTIVLLGSNKRFILSSPGGTIHKRQRLGLYIPADCSA